MSASEIITLVIAVYGGVLSTVVFIAEIMNRRRILRVRANWGLYFGFGGTKDALVVTISNPGHVPVTACEITIELGRNRYAHFLDRTTIFSKNELPAELAPGTSSTHAILLDMLKSELDRVGHPLNKPIVVNVSDGLGRRARSNRYHLPKD